MRIARKREKRKNSLVSIGESVDNFSWFSSFIDGNIDIEYSEFFDILKIVRWGKLNLIFICDKIHH